VQLLNFLQKRYDTLVELRPKLLEAILVNVSSVLMVAGWEENTDLTEERNGCIYADLWPTNLSDEASNIPIPESEWVS
jgi:hypothetical protein